MLDFTPEKAQCTGCSACYAACPVHCITMERDNEGFLYPVASDACIHCGKCERVCPIQNVTRPVFNVEQQAFAAISRDSSVWRGSASGGAFSEICRVWDDGNTLIAGAAWDSFRVCHTCVLGVDQIAPLRKSKYVESDMQETFVRIQSHLKSNGRALFCGTPCQVAGLRAFLGKEYAQLLTIDLICHGVGSPSVFESCVRALEQQFKTKISSYEFRAKRKVHETDYLSRITVDNNKESIYLTKDPYMQLFLKQMALRPSCSANCQFRHASRQGDLTIADFKGLQRVFPELAGVKRNYSTIVVNSSKGMELLSGIKDHMELHPCSMEDIKTYNPLFFGHTYASADRNLFFEEYISEPDSAVQKWTNPAQIYRPNMKQRLYRLMPMRLRSHWVRSRRNR